MASEGIRRPKRVSHLGLVCLTSSDEVRFRTITRTRFRALEPAVQVATLRELYADNVRRLSLAIDFCTKRRISLMGDILRGPLATVKTQKGTGSWVQVQGPSLSRICHAAAGKPCPL